jgi:cystathionine beta-lyase family protein involved in aluminum resistance
MRPWRNWHTRTFEGRVGDRTSSSLVGRTKTVTTECTRCGEGNRWFFISLSDWQGMDMSDYNYYRPFGISRDVFELSEEAMRLARDAFVRVDEIREKRQLEVLRSFMESRVSESAFMAKTGYGYGDVGREKAEAVFAYAFGAEDALVRLQFGSGTHVLATCLRALLNDGDELLIVTGRPYDTLLPTLGMVKDALTDQRLYPGDTFTISRQALSSRGVSIRQLELTEEETPDLASIRACVKPDTRMVYIQKSRGYSERRALVAEDIASIVHVVREVSRDTIIFVDNCYGEFVEPVEPTRVGADLIAGSLIKNPGAGIAPSGGYIAGKAVLIEEIADCMTAVDVGRHVGPSLGFSRLLLEGLYFAPSVTASAMKGAIHLGALFSLAGYMCSPSIDDVRGDIVQTVRLDESRALEAFCRAIQASSPVDSFVTPAPAPMPGYDCDIIMASGSFVQGSTIELSADGPLRPPFIAFVQGGLTFENARLGAMKALESLRQFEGM